MNKDLKDSNKILNLKEIKVTNLDCFSSSSCSGMVAFYIECSTKHGYCEDPRFQGKFKILETKKDRTKENIYTLKVKFTPEKDDD